MKDKATTVRSWGIGLILVALILPLLGIFGAQFAGKRQNAIRRNRAEQAWERRQELLARYEEQMKSAFAGLDEQPLHETWTMATAPVVTIPDPVVAAARRIVDAYRDELEQQFPDIDHATRIEFSFVSARPEVAPRFVSAVSSDLPSEAGLYPDRFRLYGGDEGDRVPISLYLPEGSRPSVDNEAGQRWLQNYIQGELLMDRVEDASMGISRLLIGGVQVRAQLQAFGGEGAAVFTPFGLLEAIFDILGTVGLVLLVLIPPVWVYVDARLRRQPALLWFLFTLPTSVMGALIYALVTRESGRACPECGERVSPRYVVCPYCQTELKGTCPNCGQTVGHDWSYCPSCSTEL